MAANQALIQASRGTGEQFIDYGAVMQPAITGILKEMEIADNKMARFINSLPPGANIEKLPEGMRPEVERYLRDAKEEYAAAADVASKLSPRDPGYREAIDKMNSIKTGFVNLNKNLESHLANRVEFIEDKNDLSGSLPNNDNIFLTSVYAGDYDGFKVTGGELEFLDKSTNKYRRNSEFPQYSLTDAIGANKITNLRFNARKNGLQGIVDTEGYQMGVSNLFKELGAQGVIDMAFDGLDNVAGSFVDTEIRNSEKFKNLSDEQWAVEREKLKTKEGFSNYFIPFQQHVGRLVNSGAIEGKAIYDKRKNKNKVTLNPGQNYKIVMNNKDYNTTGLQIQSAYDLFELKRDFTDPGVGRYMAYDSSTGNYKAYKTQEDFNLNKEPIEVITYGEIPKKIGFDQVGLGKSLDLG